MTTLTRTLDAVPLSAQVSVALMRTLRIPDDGREYPLPPGLGTLPVHPVESLARCPAEWRERGGCVVPMHQREALWLSFRAPHWKPHAVKVGIGGVDAISGEPFTRTLSRVPQDYVVAPAQPWLDGINAGDGFIRQFVAVRLGRGATVEAQLTGAETEGGLELALFAPRPGLFPDAPPPMRLAGMVMDCCESAVAGGMGLGAGGRMRQEIFADEHGIATWKLDPEIVVPVRLVEAHVFAEQTGLPVPPTPIDVQTYIAHGLPWFELYDPRRTDIARSDKLSGVRTVDDVLLS